MIRNIFVSLPNRLVTLHEYCLVSCRTRFLTTSVLLTLKCSSSTLFVMLTRELAAICLLPLNQNTSIGKFPTAIHVIVTSSDTLAGVFAGAVLMLAGTAGQDKHNKLKIGSQSYQEIAWAIYKNNTNKFLPWLVTYSTWLRSKISTVFSRFNAGSPTWSCI